MANRTRSHRLAIIGIPFVILILVVLGIIFYVTSNVLNVCLFCSKVTYGAMWLNITGVVNGTATYNYDKVIAPYAVVHYNSKNLTYLRLLIQAYTREPITRIYLLNASSTCYQCFNLEDLFNNLTTYLNKYGFILNKSSFLYINPDELSSVPAGSTVIVPSGLLPEYMLPNSTYQISGAATLMQLLNKSDTIIYIGDNFSQSIGPQGLRFVTPVSILSQFKRIGLHTMPPLPYKINPFNFNQPTFNFSSGIYNQVTGASYGPVTYAYVNNGINNGIMIAFSNTLELGWKNSSSVASDVAMALNLRFWLTLIANGTYIKNGSVTNDTIGLLALNSDIESNTSQVVEGQAVNGTYELVTATGSNTVDFVERILPVKSSYNSNGIIAMPPLFGQTETVPMSILMNTGSNVSKRVIPFIEVYDRNFSYAQTVPIGFYNTTENLSTIKSYPFILPSGYYFAVLRDLYKRYYSTAVFYVTNLSITPVLMDFTNNSFSFSVYSNGQLVSGLQYSIDLNGGYKEDNTIMNGIIFYSLPKGTVVGYGTQAFHIVMLGAKYSVPADNIQTVMHVPTIYIEFATAAIFIVILNIILKPPNTDEYYIDVPDFPPTQKMNVRVGKNDVINVFDKVNSYYHWKYMPLTLEEIKNGVSNNIRYNNIPVSITLQNAALIMNKLIRDGSISTSDNYYAPKKWLDESGHDTEYLTVFRRLRDYCVVHAIQFTDIGLSDVADTVLSRGGFQVQVMIYSSSSGLREIKLTGEAKVFILFIDEEMGLNFMQKLYSSYGEQTELLKIGISYGYIRLIDTNNLDQLVF